MRTGESKDVLAPSATLVRKAKKIASLAQEQAALSSGQIKDWFLFLRDQAVMAQAALIRSDSLRKLLVDANKPMWNDFYERDFNAATDFEAELRNLIIDMGQLGL